MTAAVVTERITLVRVDGGGPRVTAVRADGARVAATYAAGGPRVTLVRREPPQRLHHVTQGPRGRPGADGVDGQDGRDAVVVGASYRHVQLGAASTWVMPHPLGFVPAGLRFFDSAGTEVEGILVTLTDTLVVAEFRAAGQPVAFGGHCDMS